MKLLKLSIPPCVGAADGAHTVWVLCWSVGNVSLCLQSECTLQQCYYHVENKHRTSVQLK